MCAFDLAGLHVHNAFAVYQGCTDSMVEPLTVIGQAASEDEIVKVARLQGDCGEQEVRGALMVRSRDMRGSDVVLTVVVNGTSQTVNTPPT